MRSRPCWALVSLLLCVGCGPDQQASLPENVPSTPPGFNAAPPSLEERQAAAPAAQQKKRSPTAAAPEAE